jgi:hypothetical protein
VSVRRRSKFLVLLVAVAGLAAALSACAFFKPHSLTLAQPNGIGSVHVRFELCTEAKEAKCEPNSQSPEAQYLLGIAVPKGSVAPSTVTAQPTTPGTAPIVFSRNDEVAAEMTASTAKFAELGEPTPEEQELGTRPWPPAGMEGIGYLSAPYQEQKEAGEWTVDADFGLPVPGDGSPFTGPFSSAIALGWREVSPENPASRPVHCARFEEGMGVDPEDAFCAGTAQEAQIGTSDLKIKPPASSSVFLGGKATLPFGLDFASTASNLPSFTLSAASTLPGATVALSSSSFSPPAPDAGTHRSAGSDTATVAVPSTAAPGIYEVTLTAKTAEGATVSQVAKLEVTKPVLKLGKVKLNKENGTAKLSVGVPSAGALAVSGKSIVKVKRNATGPKTIKVTIKAKGKAKKKLASAGKAKVKAKFAFQPENGAAVTVVKKITLKKKLR